MNLLDETLRSIDESGHTTRNIIFIGSEDTGHQCTWEEFRKIADIEYNNGFGAAEIATDLVIVFSDKQKIWRGEYDGSEWWEFSTPFINPKNPKEIKHLTGGMWETLERMNQKAAE